MTYFLTEFQFEVPSFIFSINFLLSVEKSENGHGFERKIYQHELF